MFRLHGTAFQHLFRDLYSVSVFGHTNNKFYLVIQDQPYRRFTRLVITEETLDKQQISEIASIWNFDISLEESHIPIEEELLSRVNHDLEEEEDLEDLEEAETH